MNVHARWDGHQHLSNRVASGAAGTMSGIETIKEFRAYTTTVPGSAVAAGIQYRHQVRDECASWFPVLFLRNTTSTHNFFD